MSTPKYRVTIPVKPGGMVAVMGVTFMDGVAENVPDGKALWTFRDMGYIVEDMPARKTVADLPPADVQARVEELVAKGPRAGRARTTKRKGAAAEEAADETEPAADETEPEAAPAE